MRFDFPRGSATALLIIALTMGCSSPGGATPGPPLTATTSTTAAVPTATSDNGAPEGLPPMKRFRIGGEGYGPVQDCSLGTNDTVTCTASWDDPYQVDTYTGSFTGTLSGLEMAGTSTTNQTGHDATDPDCLWQMETSAPVTFTFSPQGTVTARSGPGVWRKTNSGSCSGTESGNDTDKAESGPTQWTVIE
jgi:hypothetical protein